jgi:phospholipid/cholesterol/gamma-HCH transport system substrate-binding protein
MRRGRRRKRPPYKTIGLVALMVMVFACLGSYLQFRGEFTPKAKLTFAEEPGGAIDHAVHRDRRDIGDD